jgi:FkbM family methyltransferase
MFRNYRGIALMAGIVMLLLSIAAGVSRMIWKASFKSTLAPTAEGQVDRRNMISVPASMPLLPCDTEVDLRNIEEKANARIKAESRLIMRDNDGFELWTTPHGQFWVVKDNVDTLFWCLAEQEADIYGDNSMGVQQNDIVIDCGAHFGVFVRKSLDRKAKQVIAIEIAPENIECLRRTFANEIKSGRVVVFPKGVWDKEGQLILQREARTWSAHVSETKDLKGTVVPVTTIDSIVNTLNLSAVNFIKMDIEGGERNALVGAAKTLLLFQPRLAMAAYHCQDDTAVLPALILKANPAYKVCRRGYGWGNLTILAGTHFDSSNG